MSGVGGFATSQAAPDNTVGGTKLVAARVGRQAVSVINHGTTDVFVGLKGVTTTTGALLTGTKGASITLPTSDEVWGITGGAAQTVSVVESY